LRPSRFSTLAPIAAAALFLCAGVARAENVVPSPQRVVETAERYELPDTVTLTAPGILPKSQALARRVLRDHHTGAALTLTQSTHDSALGSEGYRLNVNASGITIAANGGAGIFYGLQTLDQLLPPAGGDRSVAGVDITDWPAHAWRGMHLDVSRHFFGVAVVERYIDVMARYKLNVFHWHLTDDQGWRIAIARYPRLTSVGGCRAGTEIEGDATEIDGKRYCGYYTQEQIRRVVAYAKFRNVTIVPEIEMPGHSQAAIAAYPRLGCGIQTVAVRETWGVSDALYCPTEYTFAFLENVLLEVMSLFPGRYVHIGGDEVPTAAWEHSAAVRSIMRAEHITTYAGVQGYFDRRIERFVEAHGRRVIGWDDILSGGVTPDAAIMSWHGDAAGTAAARRGNDAVMTPDGPLYFDAYQGDPNDEPQAIGDLSTPQEIYRYKPVPASLVLSQSRHIIGVQGNLWTEYVATPQHLFYMLLPRMLALSEIAWRDPQPRAWSDFELAMGSQLPWLGAHGYAFRIPNPEFSVDGGALRFANVSPSVRTVDAAMKAGSVSVTITGANPSATIRYTIDGTQPSKTSAAYASPIALTLAPNQTTQITAIVVLPDGRASTPSRLILTAVP